MVVQCDWLGDDGVLLEGGVLTSLLLEYYLNTTKNVKLCCLNGALIEQ